jgi:hypothetical protein
MLLGKVVICLQKTESRFWEKWLSACRKLKVDSCLSPCASINSKWIKDLNIRPETLKLVQERAGYTLKAIRIGKDFLSRTQATQQLRERINKWDYMKLKSSAQQKKWSLNWRDHLQNGRKIFASCTSDKGLITRIYRELKKLNSPKINVPIKKWATELNRKFSKEEFQMTKKTHEKVLTIPSHKRNTNQNHTKIPPHSC